jgi:hypothetical protein
MILRQLGQLSPEVVHEFLDPATRLTRRDAQRLGDVVVGRRRPVQRQDRLTQRRRDGLQLRRNRSEPGREGVLLGRPVGRSAVPTRWSDPSRSTVRYHDPVLGAEILAVGTGIELAAPRSSGLRTGRY